MTHPSSRHSISSSLLLRLLVLGIFLSVSIPFLLHSTIVADGEKSLLHITFGHSNLEASPDIPVSDSNVVTTSACLYTMDDNHYLIEWLAYHYHVMNLRHLIITTDPHSLTSPVGVLDRWKDRMTIELWNNSHFLPVNFEEIVHRRAFGKGGERRKDPKLEYHRARQAAFNLRCLKQHKQQDRGWTMMIDVDEYMTVHPDLLKSEPGDDFILQWNVSTPENPGSIARLLGQLILPNPDYEDLTTPCVPVYRRQFAARDSPDKEVEARTPFGFDGHDFQTIRWRRYGGDVLKYKTKLNFTCHSIREVPNKVIIDLGRLKAQDLGHPLNKGNPHTPLESICPKDVYLGSEDTPLVANHYMGTLEQWLYRVGDKRGQGYRLARYEDLNGRLGKKWTDQVCPWLGGFVKSIGKSEASRLLQGAGRLEPLSGFESNPQMESNDPDPDGEAYKVGDIVQANYKGDGDWLWAEVVAVLSNGYYNVIYLEDCNEEIGTFGTRIRRTGEADDSSNDFDAELKQMVAEQYRRKGKT